VQWLKPSTLRPGGERELAHNRVQILVNPDVRFGSKADMCVAKSHVRFTPNSDINCVFRRPLWANSGLN